MKYREGTYDKEIINEVKNCYNGLDFDGKVILDIGGNIGAFAKMATDKRAKVISFEPCPENFELLVENSPDSININRAVVGNTDKQRNFYLNKGRNKGIHSLEIKRGRDKIIVDCCNFSDMIEEYKPDILKIDIEGGEYELFDLETIPKCVKQIAIELHLKRKDWRFLGAFKIINILELNGFKPIKDVTIGEKNWTTIGVYTR